MGDTHHDPTDHSRTHHQHAGESMIDVYFWPGLFLRGRAGVPPHGVAGVGRCDRRADSGRGHFLACRRTSSATAHRGQMGGGAFRQAASQRRITTLLR